MTRRLTVGVMGHVDHGKTALVRALTGQDTDRLPEERRRGLSIALGFAHARFGEAEVDLIDMPGHERFVRTLIAGATGVDAALLVVAANEGVKPQTLEHLEIAALLGLRRIVTVVSKADLVDAATARAAAAAAEAAGRAAGLEPGRSALVSTVDGRGLEALGVTLAALAECAQPPADDGFAWLPVDRAFSLAGHGTVVTGTLRRGVLAAGDELVLAPSGRPARVRGLQVHGAPVETATPGQRVAANLRGVEPQAIPRGSALASSGALSPSRWLSLAVRAAASGPGLTTGQTVRLLFGAAEVDARLRLLEGDSLAPGAGALVQLDCAEPVAVPARERVILRIASPPATAAGGVVLDPATRRRRRRDPAVLAELTALGGAGPAEVVAATLTGAGAAGAPLDRIARLAGVSAARAAALARAAGVEAAAGVWLTAETLERVEARVLATVAAQAETQLNGVSRRRLGALLPDAGAEVLSHALDRLVAAGAVRQDGAGVRLPPSPSVAEAHARQAALVAAHLIQRLRHGGLAPPDVSALAPTPLARRVLDQLAREGRAVHTLDRVQKRDVYFHPEAVAEAKARLRPKLDGAGLTTGEAGAALGISRKFSVPLLEHLDVIRFTRRRGDRRVLGPGA